MRMKNKIQMMVVVLGSLGMSLAMPIAVSVASLPATDQASLTGGQGFITIAKGEYCQWDTEEYLVIRDQETLEKVWIVAGIQRKSDDQTPYSHDEQDIPQVDFTQEMVIAAFMGRRPTSDFSLEIKDIVGNTVYVIHYAPLYLTQKLSSALTPSSTTPYHIIQTPILPEPVNFHIIISTPNPPVTKYPLHPHAVTVSGVNQETVH